MWKVTTLGEYYDVRDGTHDSPKYVEDGYPLVTSKNLKDGKIDLSKIKYISKKDYQDINKGSGVGVGDVLMAMIGTIGNPVEIIEPPKFAIKNVALFKTNAQQSPAYLRYFLSHPDTVSRMMSDAKGTTQKFVGLGYLRNFPISVPPLAEQQRIVTKLDAAFAEIDEAILKIEAKSINAEKIFLNGVDAHFTETSAASKTSKLFEITSKIGSGATPKGGKAAYKTEGISLIRSMNVHDMNFKWKDLAKIDDAQADKLSNVEVFKNDVLLNITGASVARCCVVDEAALPARVNQHVAIIRPLEDTVLTDYLAYLLVSKTYKDLLLTVGEGGGATRQAITKAEIEQFTISYPSSTDEQVSLVEKFDKLRKQVLNLKANYEKQVNEFQSLKSAILAQELQPPQSEAA